MNVLKSRHASRKPLIVEQNAMLHISLTQTSLWVACADVGQADGNIMGLLFKCLDRNIRPILHLWG